MNRSCLILLFLEICVPVNTNICLFISVLVFLKSIGQTKLSLINEVLSSDADFIWEITNAHVDCQKVWGNYFIFHCL